MPKPFYWTARNCWYVKSEGCRLNIRLHPDEATARAMYQAMQADGQAHVLPDGQSLPLVDELRQIMDQLNALANHQAGLRKILDESERESQALRDRAREKIGNADCQFERAPCLSVTG